jgi:peptide/nickel transport system permease protein
MSTRSISSETVSAGQGGGERKTTSPLVPCITIGIIGAMVLIALLADAIAPYSATETALMSKLLPPFSPGHILGTDQLGRDILSRLIHGARVSLSVAALSIMLGGTAGTILGIVAGYFGRVVDAFIMRVADMMIGFPLLILAILFAAVFGPSFANVVIILALVMWAKFARIARGETLRLKGKDFISAARVAGASPVQIIWQHVVPHLLNSILIMASLQAAWAVILEASLSFLGAGVPPPAPSWGGMISAGRTFVTVAWWLPLLPGIAIMLLVLSLNLLGDWLRDHLDPRLRQAQ